MGSKVIFTINNMPSTSAYQKKIRARWKRNGMCSMCGTNKADRKPKLTCTACSQRYCGYVRKLKLAVIKGYNGACACCGEQLWQFLSVDHVTERGADERRRLKVGTSAGQYRRLIAAGFPPTHQVLCYNCNMSLGFFGYCPHRPEVKRSIEKRK